jgi:hypothetical protein
MDLQHGLRTALALIFLMAAGGLQAQNAPKPTTPAVEEAKSPNANAALDVAAPVDPRAVCGAS